MASASLILRPADVLMFRDSRPFALGGGRAVSEHAPTPRTLLGALRAWLMTAHGVDFDAFRTKAQAQGGRLNVSDALPAEHRWIGSVRCTGPFLWKFGQTYYAAPASLVKLRSSPSSLARLVPLDKAAVPGWEPPPGSPSLLQPLGLPGDAEWEPLDGPAWMSEPQLKGFLSGGTLPPARDLITSEQVRAAETRTGITIDAMRGTVEESALYSAVFTRLQRDWAIRVDLSYPDDNESQIKKALQEWPWLRLGGEKRAVSIERRKWAPHPEAQAEAHAEGSQPLLYLATPGCFGRGWLPAALSDTLAAAATDRPLAFSGWNLARRRPEPSRWAVRAGAVYYLKGDAPALDNDCLSDEPADRDAGWGVALKGTWTA